MSKVKTFGEIDARSLEQLERCMEAGDADFGVLCADHHPGYSQPIGGAIAYEGYVSPSGVGYDIGCGNKAAQTELTRADLDAQGGVEQIMREITRRISFGMGVPAMERVEHPVLDRIRSADFAPQRKLSQLAASQLGTVGSGNHYVNVMEDENGQIWVGVHFGSRGFGHKTASGFLALAQGLAFDVKAHEGETDSPPVLFEIGSELGESYIAAMELAGEYAYAGRDAVVEKVLEILGAESGHEVHNHHNFAWREEHFGRTYWMVRKGCTPARPGQEGFVGGSMGDESVILEGAASADATESLFSTVHGAGRVMSRTKAAGRVRRRPGGVQAPAGGARRTRRLDPGEAHAASAQSCDGRPRGRGSVQGLRAAKAAFGRSGLVQRLGKTDRDRGTGKSAEGDDRRRRGGPAAIGRQLHRHEQEQESDRPEEERPRDDRRDPEGAG